MPSTVYGQLDDLLGLHRDSTESDNPIHSSMDEFLASIEKQAYVIAYAACNDRQNALDIVQDSMFKMVRNYAKKPAHQWRPLFFKVLQNRITDQHRKRGFGRLVQWFGQRQDEDNAVAEAVEQLPSGNIAPDRLADSSRLNDAVAAALSKLSPKQQQAIVLRLWQGQSVKETAQAMGISEGSVKTHLSRAVHEMREQLKEYRSL